MTLTGSSKQGVSESELVPPAVSHIVQLDGIRGVACLMVVIHHYTTAVRYVTHGTPVYYFTQVLAPFLVSGVDLFFVLSGFLIGGILMDNRSSGSYFKSFYMRRICRISPVYYLLFFSFLFILLSGLPNKFPQLNYYLFNNPWPLWSYAIFLQNIFFAKMGEGAHWMGITWSLAVEEQFYLLFPMIVRLVPVYLIPRIAFAAIILAPVNRLLCENYGGYWAAYALLPCRMDALMVGVLVAYMVRKPLILAYLQQHYKIIYALVTYLITVTVLSELNLISGIGTMRYSFLALIYGFIIILPFIRPQNVLNKFFKLKVLTFLGLISYALYMYHQAINGLLHGFIRHQAPKFDNKADYMVTALAFVLSILASYLSYVIMEHPIRNWGKRFKY